MIREICAVLLVLLAGGTAMAQSDSVPMPEPVAPVAPQPLPTFPVPGTDGGVVLSPTTPPIDNPGNVITISPGNVAPNPAPGNPAPPMTPGVIITIPQ